MFLSLPSSEEMSSGFCFTCLPNLPALLVEGVSFVTQSDGLRICTQIRAIMWSASGLIVWLVSGSGLWQENYSVYGYEAEKIIQLRSLKICLSTHYHSVWCHLPTCQIVWKGCGHIDSLGSFWSWMCPALPVWKLEEQWALQGTAISFLPSKAISLRITVLECPFAGAP